MGWTDVVVWFLIGVRAALLVAVVAQAFRRD